MNTELQKMLDTVKQNGVLTVRQKEIILNKVDALGEDREEVEFILETIPLATGLNAKAEAGMDNKVTSARSMDQVKERIITCPRCGAQILDTMFSCPECGYVFQHENKGSSDSRSEIARLQEKLLEAAMPISKAESRLTPLAPIERQVTIIKTFTMPTTKEGLIQFLEFSYSNFCSIGKGFNDAHTATALREAWYGKTIQSYNALKRIGTNDPDVEQLLNQYKSLISKEKRKLNGRTKFGIVLLLLLALCCGGVYFGCKSDEEAHERVEQLLREGDYQGARNAAKYDTDRDLVSISEVLHLISEGDLQKAKVVAATIIDEEKRKKMSQAVEEAEK